jgi:hypothetical protein
MRPAFSMLFCKPKYPKPYALINSRLYVSSNAGLKPLLTTECIQIRRRTFY